MFYCELYLCDWIFGFFRNCLICVKFFLFLLVIFKIIFIWGDVLKIIIFCMVLKWISLVVVEFDEEFNFYFGWCLRSFLGVDKYFVEIVLVC